jgi:hypothetical protein
LIRRGIETGEFRRLDAAHAVKSMIAPVLLSAIWKTVFEPLGGEYLDIEGLVGQHVDIVLRGIAP